MVFTRKDGGCSIGYVIFGGFFLGSFLILHLILNISFGWALERQMKTPDTFDNGAPEVLYKLTIAMNLNLSCNNIS